MHLINSICSIVGMRSYAFPEAMGDSDIKKMMQILDLELRKAVSEGMIVFRCGMSMGADIWSAKAVLNLRKVMPQIKLHCFLPCETQANQWSEQWREPYFQILAEADEVFCLQSHYTKGCFHRRNREMLSGSLRAILIYGTKADGGIAQAIDFCQSRGIETKIIKRSREEYIAKQPDDSIALDPQYIDHTLDNEPIIKITDYISSQTSSAYLAGLDMGISAINSAWP